MRNAVNREIPEEFLKDGKEVCQGKYYIDGRYIKRDSPKIRRYVKLQNSKLCSGIREVCEHCGVYDGTIVSLHSKFREEDYVASMATKVPAKEMGLKDITTAVASLGNAQDLIVDYAKQGRAIGTQTSGVRGRIGEMIFTGKLAIPAVIRSHGGCPRAVGAGEVHIDVASLIASTLGCWGNAEGTDDKNSCGSMGFVVHDSRYVDHTIIVTDTLVDFPNRPPSISAENVDCACVTDNTGDATETATKEARVTKNPCELMMAEHVAEVIVVTPYFTDGLSPRTGADGLSLTVNCFIEKRVMGKRIKMGLALGEVISVIYQLLDKGLVGAILNMQNPGVGVIKHLARHPKHHETSMSEHADPANKGVYVNQLDFAVLSALEIDVNFNVNAIAGPDGTLRGTSGGRPDTAADSKCCITITSLIHGRIVTVRSEVVIVATSGDCVDILATGYGIAVNPLRNGLTQCLDAADAGHMTIGWLRDKAYNLAGIPDAPEQEDQVVAVVEARDGTLLDVVRKIRPPQLDR